MLKPTEKLAALRCMLRVFDALILSDDIQTDILERVLGGSDTVYARLSDCEQAHQRLRDALASTRVR